MKRFCCLLVLAAAPWAYGQKSAKVSDNFSTPMNETIADDCTGEEVQVQGDVHTQYTAHETADGFHAEAGSNYQGVSGVGVTSGRKYQLVGSDRSVTDFRKPFPSRSTVVQTVRIISQGSAPNSHYKVHWHYTIDANGRLNGEVFKTEVECRGK